MVRPVMLRLFPPGFVDTMQALLLLSALASTALGFPAIAKDPQAAANLATASALLKRATDPLGISQAETNCGPTPCLTFDPKDQLVSVTGQNAYQSPAVSDIRGPCPGLNAAANHGYLPRSG